jgi:hypothetical protein
MSVYKFDCTPEQYHAGLDILWDALGNPPADGRLVWQRVADKIASQSAEIDRLRDALLSIEEHEHCCNFGGLEVCNLDYHKIEDLSDWENGCVEGHRCAAKIARKALNE